jgi:hypothetical protein
MTTRKLSAFALLWCSLWALSSPAAKAAAVVDPLLVVVALTFPGSNISYANLKGVFRGQPVALQGQRLLPINHPLKSPLRVDFDRMVLGLEPAAVGSFWIDMRIRDQGRPPTTASSSELAVQMVAALPGALTYATKTALTAKVKVLTVDEKAAGKPAYALQP